MKHTTKSPDETFRLAKDYAGGLKGGEVIALVGELGAGKTRFVQGLAAGLDVPEKTYVRSPSFTLMTEYSGGRLDLFHFDFYRLRDARELFDLGLEEYLSGDGVAVVEWADRFPGALPAHTVKIEFRIVDESTREIEFVR